MFIDDTEGPISLLLLLYSSGEISGKRLGNQAINKVSEKGVGSAANRPKFESALFFDIVQVIGKMLLIKPVETMEG